MELVKARPEQIGALTAISKAAFDSDVDVGDPFKDTAGPSINTQMTVVSLVASLTSALFVAFSIFK